MFRLFSVYSLFSVCYFFLFLLQLPIVSIMGRFGRSGCQNDHIDLPDMIGYLKVAPLPPMLIKKELNKYIIHISAIWRATEIKLGIWVNYPQLYYWHLFWCHVSHLGFLWFRSGPLKPAPATCFTFLLLSLIKITVIYLILYHLKSKFIGNLWSILYFLNF